MWMTRGHTHRLSDQSATELETAHLSLRSNRTSSTRLHYIIPRLIHPRVLVQVKLLVWSQWWAIRMRSRCSLRPQPCSRKMSRVSLIRSNRARFFQSVSDTIWKVFFATDVDHQSLVATAGFLGIAAYRIYKARERGGMRLSHFLIHTRLAAQGFAVAVLGSLVLYSLGERVYKNVTGAKSSDSN